MSFGLSSSGLCISKILVSYPAWAANTYLHDLALPCVYLLSSYHGASRVWLSFAEWKIGE